MHIACLDLEGVLVPEVWINFALFTGIEALKATTRDVPNYDVLMKQRLAILRENNLRLQDIQNVISFMKPLDGAVDFLNWLREYYQVVILSDTFYEFAAPLMKQLGWPTLLCHRLTINDRGEVVDYVLRQNDGKKQAVKAFKNMKFKVIACGDSYNDTTMLSEADAGILFRPPQNVIEEFPQFPVINTYAALQSAFLDLSKKIDG